MTSNFSKTKEQGEIVPNYIEILLYFSALLQADRGSFSKRIEFDFDLTINTSPLIKSDSKLSEIRSRFQNEFRTKYDIGKDLTIIQAPTGIGKTKFFLDLISSHINTQMFNKVLYFSPLLALTEDFENKIKQVVKQNDLDQILVYNHLFSGSLLDKNAENETPSPFWDFDNESFNRKFIITTTQRLLITLYSNSSRNNLKLLSLKNALLIIDEIQVIPKFLIPNFLKILSSLCKLINSKILLVSATVPAELLQSEKIHLIRLDNKLESIYHDFTLKKVQFLEKFPDYDIIKLVNRKNLFMVNTKRKAARIFRQLDDYINLQLSRNKADNKLKIYYITTGIRKKTRSKLISEINNSDECVVVSTQVIEAGVDISFDTINREMAPLDNIIQVMGRLNREGNTKDPIINVFLFDDDKDHRPYNRLEFDESLKVIVNVSNSQDLYLKLEQYYKTINSLNATNRNLNAELEEKMSNYDFPGVWDFINKELFQNEFGEPVIVPENEEELEKIKGELLNDVISLKIFYKKYGNLTAILPVRNLFVNERNQKEKKGDDKEEFKDLKELLDPELFEKNILLPKTGCLDKLYDSKIGLDKWIKI
jgi:CRISPR-associated endonuclease/helicase Cas3